MIRFRCVAVLGWSLVVLAVLPQSVRADELVVRVRVRPDSVRVAPGENVVFTAQGYDESDRPVAFVPLWSASGGGTIDADGLFVAGNEEGAFTITATDPRSGAVGGASVLVLGSPPPEPVVLQRLAVGAPLLDAPTRLEVVPGRVDVRAGGTVRFTVLVHDADGTVSTPMHVAWYASGGQVDALGTFQAGDRPGLHTVTVRLGAMQASATVRVVGGPAVGTIVRIDVEPAEVRLSIGQIQRFVAIGYDARGSAVTYHPYWSTTGGGVIGADGVFRATTAGSYSVVARDPMSQLYAVGRVWIGGGSADGIAALRVYPQRAQVRPGQRVQFQAFAYDRFGRPVPFAAVWSATGGPIDRDGVYVAGPDLGTFEVAVRDAGGSGRQDTATVLIAHNGDWPHPADGRIEITHWDVGGGNFLRPRAKIELVAHGRSVQAARLFAVGVGDRMDELQAASCTHGQAVSFDAHFDRLWTQAIEIRLYDSFGRTIARDRRAAR